jgi:anti-sigma factor RsiW
MTDLIHTSNEAHDRAEELLPWYASGRLDAADRLVVEEHLSSCAHCREQLSLERRLVQEFRGLAPEVDAGWARLRNRIPPTRARRSKPNPIWGMVRHPAVATLAAAQVAFLVFGGAILLWLSRPTYHALGSPPPSSTADVIVMFRADATVEDVQSTLKAANASIVDGPTDADAYLLHVPERQRNLALARLRSDDDVQMAEPIDGGPQ